MFADTEIAADVQEHLIQARFDTFSLETLNVILAHSIQRTHQDCVRSGFESGVDELLGRSQDSQFHDIEAGLPKGAGQDFCSDYMSVLTDRTRYYCWFCHFNVAPSVQSSGFRILFLTLNPEPYSGFPMSRPLLNAQKSWMKAS